MANIASLPEPVKGLKYDGKVWIATGKSRHDTAWKNVETSWSKFLRRLKEPTRTTETYAEYLKMSHTEQGIRKDVGGFVGGTLTGGRRKAEAVDKRYLLAFDVDKATPEFIEDFDMLCDFSAMIYSTHKHSPEAPRLRIIIPLSRSVTPDEYEALERKLAEDLGWMPYLDASTFQPSRLMYWGSCSRDAEYIFRYWDFPWLDPDDILEEYPDWTDASYWPVHPDEYRVDRSRKGQKQADPTQKKGLVGVFCRTYDVPTAIAKFLPDVYTPTTREDRYTYAPGSTSGGLVVYDDGLFAYSNHGTDPASGMDCNAFDLVRVHLFGEMDEEAKANTPANKMPSFLAMEQMILDDPDSKQELIREKTQSAAEDFEDAYQEPPDDSWKSQLEVNRSGIVKSARNLVLILTNDPRLSGIRYNVLEGSLEIEQDKPVPWRKDGGPWTNADNDRLFIFISKVYTEFSQRVLDSALTEVAHQRQFHPIKEYLEGLPPWDGVKRIETLFIDYLGAEDNVFVREATSLWMRAAVARIYKPGCKFDYIPVISGPGGIGKSTLMQLLGVNWFSDSLTFEDMKDKTAAEKLQGSWINEISELKGMRKTEVEAIKSFISRQVDKFRPAYGHVVEQHPRTCVFIGTSNDQNYLRDITGNRRFWPIKATGQGNLSPWDLGDEDVQQLWAEAMQLYKDKGARRLILSKQADVLADQAQTEALETDEREGLIEAFMEVPLPEDWYTRSIPERRRFFTDLDDETAERGTKPREFVAIIEIWCECFGLEKAKINRREQDEVAAMLKRLGYEQKGQKRIGGNYGRPHVWVHKGVT